MTVEAPGGAREILLHACCAPCSGAVLECLRDSGIRPVVFFSNSNISPRAEYELRLSELRRYGDVMGVEVVADEYDHEAWLAAVRGLEREPERGARCAACFRFRLERAVRYAASRGLPVLATTLASSRWKDLDQVNAAGLAACNGRVDPGKTVATHGLVNGRGPLTLSVGEMSAEREVLQGSSPVAQATEVVFWAQNWRKGGLQPRRNEIIREQNFYNQTWCGCEFSRNQREDFLPEQ
ncbi:MAG: epoxyqueuosine reductase QueH [Bacteroidales bacterium]|nr:epoxyqueuosine reductase QueH [Bacteroidales bacterium]